MGRGLSDLQGTILRLALANRPDGGRPGAATSGADVVTAEVLAALWGLEFKRSRGLGSQHHSKAAVGVRRYNAAHAAVSRAFARLEQRGLVAIVSGTYSRWSGVNLTAAGVAEAERLSVKTAAILPQS
jgi:hypothetical protein